MTAEQYTHGHHGAVVSAHSRRGAEDSAGFLLSSLTGGETLLDLGCGPGSITLDLAARVAAVVGVDAAPVAIEWARRAQSDRRVTNARFVVADAGRLPFDDQTFDVVFAHQLLQHVARPVEVLREAARVLRPGGLVAVRDADYGTMVHHPHRRALDDWLELYHRVARAHGGEPDAGRRLPAWVASAGFVDPVVTTSTWTYADRRSVTEWTELWIARLGEARLGEAAVELGFADRVELGRLVDGFRSWAASDSPFFAFLHGEVLARRP